MSAFRPVSMLASELRVSFDRTFTFLPSTPTETTENLLAIKLDGNPYALRLRDIAGLVNDKKIIALPSTIPEFLGIAGIRGTAVAVYSLAALLGYSGEANQSRWLALYEADEPVALAFQEFEGYTKVPFGQIFSANEDLKAHEHIKDVVGNGETVRPMIDLRSVIEAIQKRCGLKPHAQGG